MTDKALRLAGLFVAPVIMLVGLWLCLEGLEHGKLTGIFSIGPSSPLLEPYGLSRIGLLTSEAPNQTSEVEEVSGFEALDCRCRP
jgi:hypothetical protein